MDDEHSNGTGELNKKTASILVADICDYSNLDRYDLGRFFQHVIPEIADILDNNNAWEQNSWGDGVVAFFNSPKDAALCSLEIRDRFRNKDWAKDPYALSQDLEIRIALHTATIYEGHNAIRDSEGFAGTGINLTARIEPIVKPNHVFSSTRFINSLKPLITGNDNIAWDSLFDLELAKGWGEEQLHHLRRADNPELEREEATVSPDSSESSELPSDLQSLRRILTQSDVEMQIQAVQYLAEDGRVEAIKPLEEVLKEPDDYPGTVRVTVAGQLDKFKDARVVPTLIEAARNDSEPDVRYNAILSLGNLGDLRAFETLVNILENDSEEKGKNRAAAANALTKLEDERVVEPLINALEDPDQQVRVNAVSMLGEIGNQKAVDPIIDILQSPDKTSQDTRIAAIGSLTSLGGPDAMEGVLQAVEDPASKVRAAAIEGLEKFDGIDQLKVVENLVKATEDSSILVQKRAANVLGTTGAKESLECLMTLVTDTENTVSDVRAIAADALGELEEPQAIDELIKATEDPSSKVRSQALRALGNMKALQAVEQIESLATNEIPAIEDVRHNAAIALGEIGEIKAQGALLEATEDPSEEVQVAAVNSLGSIHAHSALEELEEILRNNRRTDAVRREAALSLGEIGQPSSVEPLMNALDDPSTKVQRGAITALADIGGNNVLQKLKTVLTQKEEYAGTVRAQAAFELKEFDDPVAISALMTVLEDESAPERVKGHAVQALGKIGGPEAAEKVASIAADSTNPARLRRVSLSSLGLLQNPQTEPTITDIIQNSDELLKNRKTAILSLRCIGTETSQELLNDIAGRSKPISMAAQQALAMEPSEVMEKLREMFEESESDEGNKDKSSNI